MRIGAFFSAAFHIAIIAFAMTSFANSSRFDVSIPVNIPVEILEVGAETNVSAAVEADPEEIIEEVAPEVVEPQVAALRPEPEPVIEEVEPEFSPFEEPEPVVEEAAPEPEPPAPQVRPEPRPQPAPRERDFFADTDFEALIDRAPREQRESVVDPNAALGQQAQMETAERRRNAAGLGTGLTVSEIDALKGQIQQCWNFPAGVPDPESIVVILEVRFNRDGTLIGQPRVLDMARYRQDTYFRTVAESAVRAVVNCQTRGRVGYDLPVNRYSEWQLLEIEFDLAGAMGLR